MATAASPHMFPPGSPWLFAKLYCGLATADFFLRELVPALVDQARSQGWADRWFFIRYADPDQHLRIRFHGEPKNLYGCLLSELHAQLQPHLDSGALARWQIDTYQREINRYGGPDGIEMAEELFEADSDAVLAILSAAGSGDTATDQRWRLAVCGADRLLADLGLDLKARLEVATVAGEAMAPPGGNDPEREHQLSQDFRKDRRTLETMLRGQLSPEDPLSAALKCLEARSARLVPLGQKLHDLLQAGRLSLSLQELSQSYIHMHTNRLLRSRHREFELVIYDALQRLYESTLARQTRTAKDGERDLVKSSLAPATTNHPSLARTDR